VISSATPDLLEAIVAATRRIVEVRRTEVPMRILETGAAAAAPDGAAFRAALTRTDRWNVIAECKRRSPSRGVLCQNYDAVRIARAYEGAGAAALSVLTEPTFFDGALDHLSAVRAAVRLPLLRKDFIVDEYQLLEARAHGADAVLLIVAALDDRALVRLGDAAQRLGLAALVEVHSVDELDRALAGGASIVGVNNRNLRTLDVDLCASESVAAHLPAGVVAVSESGLKTTADLEQCRRLGYHAFLMGERFMTTADPGAALTEVIGT